MMSGIRISYQFVTDIIVMTNSIVILSQGMLGEAYSLFSEAFTILQQVKPIFSVLLILWIWMCLLNKQTLFICLVTISCM